MQFKVPQNVQREDKIVGPLTLKQLIITSVGGIIAYAIYIALAKTYLWITWLPPVAIVTVLTLAFAFLRPLNLSFAKWILLWIEYSILPRKRIWVKSSANIIIPLDNQTKHKKIEQKKLEEESLIEEKKLEELKKFLESQQNK